MRLLRYFSHVVALAFVVATLIAARPALAQDAKVEKAARALQKKAMEEDYLGTEFAAAQQKLDKAIASCGTDKCSAQMRAQLRRDLGVVLIGGQIDKDKGQAAFIEALKIDPSVSLDPDLKTKELETAFEAARKKAMGAPGETKSAGGATAAGGAVAGDFTHTPVAEGQIRTPLPVFVEYAGSEAIVKVIVRYKGFGMQEFKPLDLHKVGNGWGGYIPCADVSNPGTLQYYVQGFNDQNDPVATAGDRNNTYKVAIKQKIAGTPAALPGEQPPKQCIEAGDCPGPEFPCWAEVQRLKAEQAAKQKPGVKPEGAECDESGECQSLECKANKCTAPAEEGAEGGKPHKIWIGGGLSYGFALLQQGSDVCKLDDKGVPLNSPSYYCITDGRDYPTRATGDENANLQTGKAGSIDGGFTPSSLRLFLSLDYLIKQNFMLGLRLGGVLTGVYPGSEAQKDAKSNSVLQRLHAEARFTYMFGKAPLTKTSGFLFLAGGVSEFHGSVDVPVAEANAGTNRKVTAYLIGGPAFVGIGGGPRIKLSDSAGLLLGPRVDLGIGYVGVLPVVSLEGAVQFGL